MTFKKYKTFSVLIYSNLYQHEWNWENEKSCGNTAPAGGSGLNLRVKKET